MSLDLASPLKAKKTPASRQVLEVKALAVTD